MKHILFYLILVIPTQIILVETPQEYPKITLPWSYSGEDENDRHTLVNHIGSATARLLYSSPNDSWTLQLTVDIDEVEFIEFLGLSTCGG
jgi:hypothetical protein